MTSIQDSCSRPYSCFQPRATGLSLRIFCLAVFVLLAGSGAAQAQDGQAILLKTLKLYQSLHSYAGQANVDTMMITPEGQTVKHIGSSTVMKLLKPNKIYLFFQTPIGSRSIYCDGTNFTVYDGTPNQYLTVPAPTDTDGLLNVLLSRADVAAGLDPLFFLTRKSLPKELSDVKVKGSTTFNGHPCYIVTGTTNAKPVVIKSGNTITTIPSSYWAWWIDRTSFLLYKVETRTPNIVKPVSFGTGPQHTVRNVKGTLMLRHTVSEIKPDTNLQAGDFVFKPPMRAVRRQSVQDILDKKGK
jgi:outer membrane lipoprotein-sorting protein